MRDIAVVVSIVGAVAAGVLLRGGPAHAAVIDVDGCVVDGNLVTVEVDDATLVPYEGKWYALHTASGDPVDHDQPQGTLNEVPPVCVAPVREGEIDSTRATWAWCLEAFDAVCAEDPFGDRDFTSVLFEEQAQLVGWRIDQWAGSGDTSPAALWLTQYHIWCITDGYDYFGADWSPGVDCSSYRDWLDTEILPGVPTMSDHLSITWHGSGASTGTPEVVVVETTMAFVEVIVQGADSVEICDPASESTLVGTRLTRHPDDTSVELCVGRGTSGDVSIVAESGAHYTPEWVIGYPDEDCQVLFTDVVETLRLNSATVIGFNEMAYTTTTTTTVVGSSTTDVPGETTTTVDSSGNAEVSTTVGRTSTTPSTRGAIDTDPAVTRLPVTGGHNRMLAGVAAVLCVVGAALTLSARRGQSTS